MGRDSSLRRAALLDRPALAYLHRFPGQDGWHDYELSYGQVARTADWAAAQLAGHGLRRGDRALLTFSGWEAPWSRPLADAVRRLGIVYCTAETARWDHGRARYFAAELAPRAVLGLSLETAEALAEESPLAEVFRPGTVLLARPDAVPLLRSAGVDAATLALVGPALGLECPRRAGVHVDGGSWVLRDRDGRPEISGAPEGPDLPPVALPFTAGLVTGQCGCGSTDPRLVLADPAG